MKRGGCLYGPEAGKAKQRPEFLKSGPSFSEKVASRSPFLCDAFAFRTPTFFLSVELWLLLKGRFLENISKFAPAYESCSVFSCLGWTLCIIYCHINNRFYVYA